METLRKFLGRKRRFVLVRISLTGRHPLQIIDRFRRKREAIRTAEELNFQEKFWDTGEIVKIREL